MLVCIFQFFYFEVKIKKVFTGIVELVGKVTDMKKSGANLDIKIESEISNELQIDQSVSHNGVCLTVTKVEDKYHWATAINETLKKSNLGELSEGDKVNIERCMTSNGRFDGHIVQGHVDTTARVADITGQEGSWLFEFEIEDTNLIVEKGSICINGTSLTCFDVRENKFSIAIIPYTFEYTNFNQLNIGDVVNIEYDIIGKYIQKILNK